MMTTAMLDLAEAARPIDESDYGSDRQVEAENKFFDECRRIDAVTFDYESPFGHFCLKATTCEAIDEAKRILFAMKKEAVHECA